MEQQGLYPVAKFAAKFCNELGTEKTSICSPLSAEILLALLALGCKNQSHAELLKAMDLPNDDAIRFLFGLLTSSLKDIKGVTLNVANKVYLKKGGEGELKPSIKKDAEEVFQSSLEQLDFNEKEAAAGTINNWVAEQTNNMITQIVSPDMMTEYTRLVMVNAVYFQGLWEIPFYKSHTENRRFHLNKNSTIHVPMMSLRETYFDYGVSPKLKARLLRMGYQGGEASMVIVLPDEVEGLKAVLQKIASGHNIMDDIENMCGTELDVKIPKFKVETTMNLTELLPKLGIKSIFNEKEADIDMLTSKKKLFVSDAIQKAVIIVDENGTEAAACTGMVEFPLCRRQKEYFTAEHPFLYMLTAAEIPLFLGVYGGSEYAQIIPPETKRAKNSLS